MQKKVNRRKSFFADAQLPGCLKKPWTGSSSKRQCPAWAAEKIQKGKRAGHLSCRSGVNNGT